jgi:hypothetical protein
MNMRRPFNRAGALLALALTGAACAAVLVVNPPNAFADPTPNHPDLETTATPTRVVPGDNVLLNTTACRRGGARADATAVDGGTFSMEPTLTSQIGYRKNVLSGRFRVSPDTEPGNYVIKVRCDDGRRSERTLEVYPTRDRHDG